MANYTFLVIGRDRGDKTGKISNMQKGGGKWGKKEVAPRFERIRFDGSHDEANWIFRCCKYDFAKEAFVHQDDPTIEFDRVCDVVPKKTDFGGKEKKHAKDKALAELLTNTVVTIPCSTLRAGHAGEFGNDERSYWVKLYWPFRKQPGVKTLIEAAKYGVYSDCRAAFRELSKTTQDAILAAGSQEDKSYLRWLYLAENADEAAREL